MATHVSPAATMCVQAWAAKMIIAAQKTIIGKPLKASRCDIKLGPCFIDVSPEIGILQAARFDKVNRFAEQMLQRPEQLEIIIESAVGHPLVKLNEKIEVAGGFVKIAHGRRAEYIKPADVKLLA
jgi:hypothetical protein